MRLDKFLLENMRVFLPGNMRLCFVWWVYVGLGVEWVKVGKSGGLFFSWIVGGWVQVFFFPPGERNFQ
jgi:hypothetical protein